MNGLPDQQSINLKNQRRVFSKKKKLFELSFFFCDVCYETSSWTNTLVVPSLFQTSAFRVLFGSKWESVKKKTSVRAFFFWFFFGCFSFHYFLAALEDIYSQEVRIRLFFKKTTFLKASCWTEKLRHACSFQVISTSFLLSVTLQSTDTEHTHIRGGLHGEFFLQYAHGS